MPPQKLSSQSHYTPPIIFVAHSLGGLVVKQALVTAKNNDDYKKIREATVGLVFFAVPHRGGHGASLGTIAKNIVVSLTGEGQNNLVESLKQNSFFQESQAALFKHQLEDYHIISVIEDRPTKFTKFLGKATSIARNDSQKRRYAMLMMVIVDKKSATLGLAGTREKILTVSSNHSEVCQFEQDDDKFEPVKRAIGNLADTAVDAASNSAAERARVSVEAEDPAMREEIKRKICAGAPVMTTHLARIEKSICAGTATWLQDRPAYEEWLQNPSSRLWIKGKAGAGKSHIAARTIKALQAQKPSAVSVAYLFSRYNDSATLDPTKLAKSFILQLLPKLQAGGRAIQSLHRAAKDESESWQELAPLLNVVSSILAEIGPLTLVIDGLDEAPDMTEMVDFVRYFAMNNKVTRVIAFARSTDAMEEGLTGIFNQTYTIRDSDMEEDIGRYLQAELAERKTRGKPRRFKINNPTLEQTVIDELQKGARGMFLWASCMLDEICLSRTDDDIRAALKDLPDGMYEIYSRMQGKILTMHKHDRELAKKSIAWILCSRRPMSFQELAIAAPLKSNVGTWSPSSALTDPHEIIHLCCGFVLDEGGYAHVIHASAGQYLRSDHAAPLASDPKLDSLLLSTCADFLLSPHDSIYELDIEGAFGEDRVRWRRGYEPSGRPKPAAQGTQEVKKKRETGKHEEAGTPDWPSVEAVFTDYCLRYWTFHAQKCQEHKLPYADSALRILRDQAQCEMWLVDWMGKQCGILDDLQREMFLRDYHWAEQEMPSLLKEDLNHDSIHPQLANFTSSDMLTVIAFLGLKDCLEVALATTQWVYQKGSFLLGNSPLHGAAAGRSRVVCEYLLQHKFEVDIRNGVGQTPFLLAAQAGSDSIGGLLIAHGASTTVQDDLGFSALHYVATEDLAPGSGARRLGFVQMLKDCSSLAALSAPSRQPKMARPQFIVVPEGAKGGNRLEFAPAAMLGYRLELACADDIDIEGRGAPNASTTYFVMLPGQEEEYKILNPPERKRDLTPLHQAINEDQGILLPELLKMGADINEVDSNGRSLLHKATRHADWDMALVEYLIEAGADIRAKDERGRTPLHHAAVLGYSDAAEHFLALGADIDAQDNGGQTPLHMLCDAGCLIWNNKNQVEKTLNVLLKYAPNLETSRQDAFTPLGLSIFNEWLLGAQTLYDAGAQMNRHHATVLFLGTVVDIVDQERRDQHNPFPRELLTLLLDMGADIDCMERIMHCSALNFAVFKGNAELVDFLIANGASLRTLGPPNIPPVFIVLASKEMEDDDTRLRIAQSLLTAGADPNEYQQDMTPLSYIIMMMEERKADFARLYVDYGADVGVRMSTGQSYLDIAVQYGSSELELIKLLLCAPRRAPDRSQDDLAEIFEEVGVSIRQMPGEAAAVWASRGRVARSTRRGEEGSGDPFAYRPWRRRKVPMRTVRRIKSFPRVGK